MSERASEREQEDEAMAQGDEEATTTGVDAATMTPKKRWQEQEEKRNNNNNNNAGGGKTFRELMIERVGSEEHSAISQVLSSQQEQFQTQVQELHSISQRQWQHVSKTLFPYLESFRPASLNSGQSATGASPLFSHEQQKAAATAMGQAASVLGAQNAGNQAVAGNWWHDPMKVMGIQHMPTFVHSGSMQASGSNQMESTMIGSHHPSAMYSGQGQNQTAKQQQQQRGAGAGAGADQMPLASSSGRYSESASQAAKRGHSSLSQDPAANKPSSQSKRQKSDQPPSGGSGPTGAQQQQQRHSLSGKGIGNSMRDQLVPQELQMPKALPVSCPQPKVATPQSAIDILLALSEATPTENTTTATTTNQGSNRGSGSGLEVAARKPTAPNQSTKTHSQSRTQLAGEAERISAKNEDKKARKN